MHREFAFAVWHSRYRMVEWVEALPHNTMKAVPESKREKKRGKSMRRVVYIIIFLAGVIGLLLTIKTNFNKIKRVNEIKGVAASQTPLQTENVSIYFAIKQRMELRQEIRIVEKSNTIAGKIKRIIDEMKKGPLDPQLNRTIPADIEIMDIFLSCDRVFINLGTHNLEEIFISLSQERIFINSIVFSILKNIGYTYDSVRILINGKETEGVHIYLGRDYKISDFESEEESL
ncbi:MAG: GerMN domain-containing protein [Candidatus Hydrogenedentota bacterium]